MDDREAANHPLWLDSSPAAVGLQSTLRGNGFITEVKRLEFGDYVIQDVEPFGTKHIVVESKTYDDLVNALRDGGAERADSRIRHQTAGLLEERAKGRVPVVMVIGMMSTPGVKGGNNTGVVVENDGKRVRRSYSFFEPTMAKLALQHMGIMVVEAPTIHRVPETLRHIAEICERATHFEDPGLPKLAMMGPKLTMLATVLTAVDGVGSTTARLIAQRYKSFAKFLEQGTVKDLQEVEGVGQLTAARIYMYFHDEPGDIGVGF